MRITTLGRVLADPESLDASEFLYLPEDGVWNLESAAGLSLLSRSDQVPVEARQRGLKYVCEMATVQDVVGNAKAQVHDATAEQLLMAFRFYYDRDAFICFE